MDIQLSCCSNPDYCDFSNPILEKAVYSPSYYAGPAISYSALSIIFIFLAIWALINIKKNLKSYRDIDVKQHFRMNVFLLIIILARLAYLLDGPIQLIFPHSLGLPAPLSYSFEVVSISFMNVNYAYSSYTWAELLLGYHGRWSRRKVDKVITGLLIADLLILGILAICDIVGLAIGLENAFVLNSYVLLITTLINGLVFAVSCYSLTRLMEEVYDCDVHVSARVRILKVMAIAVGTCALLRIVNDFSAQIEPDWQRKFNLETYCSQNFGWSGYLIGLFIIVDIIPISFFLLLFCPETKSRDIDITRTGSEANLTGPSVINITFSKSPDEYNHDNSLSKLY